MRPKSGFFFPAWCNFVRCVLTLVGFCLPRVPYVTESQPQRTWDVLVCITKLKCNLVRLASLTVKCLSGFHLPGLTGDQACAHPGADKLPRVLFISWTQTTSAVWGKGKSKAYVRQDAHSAATCSYSHILYILMSPAYSAGQVLPPFPPAPSSHNIQTCYELICTIQCQMVGWGDKYFIRVS